MRVDNLSPEELQALIDEGFSSVPLHRHLELELCQLEPAVIVEMPLDERARGLTTSAHGGAIATLVDVASSCAAALADGFEVERSQLVTIDLHVRYMRRPRGSRLRAISRLRLESSRFIEVETAVSDAESIDVVSATALYMLLNGPTLERVHGIDVQPSATARAEG
jgi:uncharacterized protein (TIGR00369 family)